MATADAPAIAAAPTAPAAPPRRGNPRRLRTLRKVGLGVAGIVGFLVTWQLLPTLGIVDPRYFPSAITTLAQLGQELRDLEFWRNVGRTMTAWGIGLLIATVLATVLGTIIGLVPFLRRATHTTVEFLRPIPSVALIPLAILMFGLRIEAALVIIVYASFWQVFIQVLYGVADVDTVARDTARSFGLARVAHRQPGLPDRTAVPHDRAAARGGRRADPRDHRRDVHRQPGTRPRDRLRAVRGQLAHGLCARHRHRHPGPAHQPRVPRHRAPLARVAPVGARGGSAVTLYTSTVVTPRRRPRVWAKIGESTLYAIGLPFVLLVIWGVWATLAPATFFPPPLEIIDAFIDTWIGPALVTDVLPSLARLAVGVTISIVVGIVAGTLIGLNRWLRELLEPMLEFFRAVPPPVLLPIVVVLMGPTDAMKIVVIVVGSVWPILLNTIEGVRATDSVMTETARSFAVTRAERLRYLVLPAASPRIMAGVRQSLSIALILMVISELAYSSSGLGYQIVYFQRNYLIAEMWSGILLLGLIGVLLATIFGFVERRVLRWYHGIKEVERA
jgi:ABC-type nitrate/sulfonate/bicarbonate transport system permease component